MGFLVSSYSPTQFPEFKLENVYVCLDLYHPLALERDFQNSSVYNIRATFLIYRSQADRANKVGNIDRFNIVVPGVDTNQNLCTQSYVQAKAKFTDAGATVTDEI